jgi:hypothetical protein
LLIACGLSYLSGENFAFHLRNNRPGGAAKLMVAIVLRAGMSAVGIAYGIAAIWWSRTVQLREHGVLHGLRLLRWDHVTNCHWSRWTSSVLLEGVDQRHRDYQVGVSVPGRHLDAVGVILSEKLPTLFEKQQIHALSYRATRQSPFVLVTQGEQVSRGCLVVFVAWVGGVAFATFIGGGQTREFGYGSLAGALASLATAFFSSRKTTLAGRPLLRLNVWFNRPALLSCAAVAGVCYYLGRLFAFTSAWISVPLGLLCGYAFVSAIRVMALDKLDLCEHGIVVRRAWFWPWEGTCVRPLIQHRSRRLEFRRGWRRVTAIVPAGHWESVEHVLKAKLGNVEEELQNSSLRPSSGRGER